MKSSLLVFCFLLGVASTLHAANDLLPYDVQRTTLDNGLEVLLVPMPSEGLVSFWSIVRTGSRDEVEEGVTGFAHFFEHMMFRGSEKYPGPVYDAIVGSMGADSNAFTSDDLTAYYLSLTRQDLPRVIEIESDRFQNLSYSEADFRTEAGAVYGEYRKGRTSPFSVLYEELQNTAFDAHTYKHTVIGFEDDIKRMPEQYEYSKGFFQRFYRPENVVLLVVGDFDPAATLDLIQEAYGGWEPGYQAPAVPEEPPQEAPRRLTVAFEGETLPILTVAFKGERFLPQDRTMAAGLLLEDLAFGETSALHRQLVLDEQRIQWLEPEFEVNRDPGLWAVHAMVNDPGDVAAIEGEIWSAVDRFQNVLVSQEALDAARSQRKYSFLSSLSNPQGVARSLVRYIAVSGGIESVEQLFATYDEVTPEDVREAARTYLTRNRSTVAVLHAAGQPIPEPTAAEPPVLLPVPQDPNVTFKLWVRAGSQNDPPGKEGLAALTAALVTQGGTASRSYEQVLAELAPMAASYSASVDREMTVLTGRVHRDLVGRFYGLFLDAVLKPGFRPADFERLKAQTLSLLEKELRYSSDEELGKAALYGEIFRGTPYEHLEIGTVEGLKSITLDDVRDFHRRHYTEGNVVIGLAGGYEEGLPARLLADLARLPEGQPAPIAAPQPEPISGRHVVLVEKPGQSTAISFGMPIDLHRGSRDFYALWLANSWLGEHRNSISHLYQVIREARGMNYGDYSYIEAFPEGGLRNMPPTGVGRRQQIFEVWLRPVPDAQALFALRAALREIDRLVASGLTQEQFEAHRNFLEKYVLQFATTSTERLGYAIDDRFYGLEDEGHLARFRRVMGELTREEVNTAIRKYLSTDDLVIAMVTADAEGLKAAMVADQPSPMDYGGVEKPAEILAEDEEIEDYPLKVSAEDVEIVPVGEMFER